MQIIVLSKRAAEQFQCSEPWAAISISTEDNNFAFLSQENRQALLQQAFWDIEYPRPAIQNVMFTREQAQQILDFVKDLQTEVLLIHCEAGASRSPAVAAALTYIQEGRAKAMRYFKEFGPNQFVFRTILAVHYQNDPHILRDCQQIAIEAAYGPEPSLL